MMGEDYDDKCDLWSLGTILYQMLYRSCPLISHTHEEYKEKLLTEDIIIPIQYNGRSISTKTRVILEKLLQKNPTDRVSWEELFEYCRLLKKMMGINIQECSFTQENKLDMRCKKNKDMECLLKVWIEEEYNMKFDTNKVKIHKNETKLRQATVNELFEKIENQKQSGEDHKIELEIERDKSKWDDVGDIRSIVKMLWDERNERMGVETAGPEIPTQELQNRLQELETKLEEVIKKNQELFETNKELEEFAGAMNMRIILLEEKEREREKTQNPSSPPEDKQSLDGKMELETLKQKTQDINSFQGDKDLQGKMELETQKFNKPKTLELELCKNDLCNNLNARMIKLEEIVRDATKKMLSAKPVMGDAKNRDSEKGFYARAERLKEVENMVKGLSMRIEKIAWDYDNKMEETQNLKTYEERISNIEGWRISIIHGLNSKVIPTLSRLQRQVIGIQSRIDAQSKFVGYNKFVYDEEGHMLDLKTDCLLDYRYRRQNVESNEIRTGENPQREGSRPSSSSGTSTERREKKRLSIDSPSFRKVRQSCRLYSTDQEFQGPGTWGGGYYF